VRGKLHIGSLLTLASLLAVTAHAAAPAAVSQCAECHGKDGMGVGKPMVPVIAGMPAGLLEEAIYAYVDGERHCQHEPRMCETVAGLSDDEVSALAEYYAGLPRAASTEPFDQDLAAKGATLYARHCAICHVRPDDEHVDSALGIPLQGQRKDYLRYALESYFNGNRTALLQAMSHELKELSPDDVDALVEFFASYRPGTE
jgi:sulfide dehydrogenase cytochrome subunit